LTISKSKIIGKGALALRLIKNTIAILSLSKAQAIFITLLKIKIAKA
jgi:hypothetical protein